MAFIQACQGENIAEHDGAQLPSVEHDGGHSGLTTKAMTSLCLMLHSTGRRASDGLKGREHGTLTPCAESSRRTSRQWMWSP